MDSIYATFVAFYDASMTDSNAFGVPNLGLFFSSFIVLLLGFCAVIYAAFLMALGKIFLAVLLAIGPIFVLGLLFEATKGFFQSWLNQIMNSIFKFALAVAVVRLIMAINQIYISSMDLSAPNVPSSLPVLAISLISLLVLTQVPSLASALGGGVAVSTLGAVGWIAGRSASGVSAMTPRAMAQRRMQNARVDRWRERNPSVVSRAAGATVNKAKGLYRKVAGVRENSVSRAA
jgi:type IV secretion system protein VirB6